MSFSPLYIISQLFFYIGAFFMHWYVGGFGWFMHRALSALERLDQTFAIKVTLRNLFEPLYQDYSIVGRILGIVFRPARLLVGGLIYLCVIAGFIFAYIVWALIPLFLLFRTLAG